MNGMTYGVIVHTDDSELYHFGVPGMKWGVRKQRYESTYNKAVNQLAKYGAKSDRYRARVTERAKLRAARAHRRAAKFERKSAKVKAKAIRRFLPMNAEKAMRKSFKYDVKATRAENKAARINAKLQKNLAKSERNINKGKKLYSAMQKEFKNVPASKINKKDVERGKALAKKYGFGG